MKIGDQCRYSGGCTSLIGRNEMRLIEKMQEGGKVPGYVIREIEGHCVTHAGDVIARIKEDRRNAIREEARDHARSMRTTDSTRAWGRKDSEITISAMCLTLGVKRAEIEHSVIEGNLVASRQTEGHRFTYIDRQSLLDFIDAIERGDEAVCALIPSPITEIWRARMPAIRKRIENGALL